MSCFSLAQCSRGQGELPWTMATRTACPPASGESTRPRADRMRMIATIASSGRRSGSSSARSTSEAANPITSTPHPVGPIHCAAPRAPGIVPIGKPAAPQGKPPSGKRERSELEEGPAADGDRPPEERGPQPHHVHQQGVAEGVGRHEPHQREPGHGAQGEDPPEHAAEEGDPVDQPHPGGLAPGGGPAQRPQQRDRGDEDQEAQIHRGEGKPHQGGRDERRRRPTAFRGRLVLGTRQRPRRALRPPGAASAPGRGGATSLPTVPAVDDLDIAVAAARAGADVVRRLVRATPWTPTSKAWGTR